VAVAVGIAAGQVNAAAPAEARKASHRVKEPKFKRPKLKHGVLTITGTNASDKIALRLQAGHPGTLQVDVGDDGSADFSFERSDVASIDVAARAGDDVVRIDDANGVFTDGIKTTIDGEGGSDAIAGGQGAETLLGGDGNDSIDGNRGNDAASMGAGDDTFVWDPGDGSDTVEGQDGFDRMLFNGANIAEKIDLSANGQRLRFFRDIANITMDTAGVERVNFNALGGADLVTVNDLSGTDVSEVDVEESNPAGSGLGDAQPDQVIAKGTNDNDRIDISGDAAAVKVTGLAAAIAILHPEQSDKLEVDALGGNDSISAAALAAQTIALTLDAGSGDDTIAGGQGAETLLGGDGNDSIDGNRGNDAASMGAGDDTFVWDPGDGSDTVEGQDGLDRMLFNGANIAEKIDLSANGQRLRFFRDIANITMDTAGVERVDFNALGGADVVTVNDLSGTDVSEVDVEESNPAGSGVGDGQPDQVIVKATNGDDVITAEGSSGAARVSGLAATVRVTNAEAANDTLTINALGGDDVVQASALAAEAPRLTADGGDGDDVLIGGAGADVLSGGPGDDVLLGGPGQDVLDGGPGDNVVIQD
jgi:Ca2+-binding RTX toxin-like protein